MNVSALVGRLTRDMEFAPYENKNTGKKGYVAKGSIAVEREGRMDKDGKRLVDFVPVQSWITEAQHDKLYSLHMKKGAAISVNGSIRVESYKDKNQQDRTFTYVEGRIELVSPVKGGNEGNNQVSQGYQGGQSQQPVEPSFEETLVDDEIPF